MRHLYLLFFNFYYEHFLVSEKISAYYIRNAKLFTDTYSSLQMENKFAICAMWQAELSDTFSDTQLITEVSPLVY